MKTKKCKFCNKEFEVRSSKAMYCKPSCRVKYCTMVDKGLVSNFKEPLIKFVSRMERQHFNCHLKDVMEVMEHYMNMTGGVDHYIDLKPSEGLSAMWKDIYDYYLDNK